MMPDLQTVLAPNPDCPVREVQDGYIVMAASGATHAFDGPAAFIWGQLDGSRDLAAILAGVVETYKVQPDEAQADLLDFANTLLAAGLVSEA
jgi:hypothetical protein